MNNGTIVYTKLIFTPLRGANLDQYTFMPGTELLTTVWCNTFEDDRFHSSALFIRPSSLTKLNITELKSVEKLYAPNTIHLMKTIHLQSNEIYGIAQEVNKLYNRIERTCNHKNDIQETNNNTGIYQNTKKKYMWHYNSTFKLSSSCSSIGWNVNKR